MRQGNGSQSYSFLAISQTCISMGRSDPSCLVGHTSDLWVQFQGQHPISEGETRLDWEAVATDAEIFTQPVVLDGYLVWVPGEEVKPFDCTIPEGFSWQLQE